MLVSSHGWKPSIASSTCSFQHPSFYSAIQVVGNCIPQKNDHHDSLSPMHPVLAGPSELPAGKRCKEAKEKVASNADTASSSPLPLAPSAVQKMTVDSFVKLPLSDFKLDMTVESTGLPTKSKCVFFLMFMFRPICRLDIRSADCGCYILFLPQMPFKCALAGIEISISQGQLSKLLSQSVVLQIFLVFWRTGFGASGRKLSETRSVVKAFGKEMFCSSMRKGITRIKANWMTSSLSMGKDIANQQIERNICTHGVRLSIS